MSRYIFCTYHGVSLFVDDEYRFGTAMGGDRGMLVMFAQLIIAGLMPQWSSEAKK